jgi:type IV secretory pathway VirB10-like protein
MADATAHCWIFDRYYRYIYCSTGHIQGVDQMISRSLAAGLLATGCLTAAAGGSYLAVRQNNAPPPEAVSAPQTEPSTPAVTETEGVVTPAEPPETPADPAVEVAPPSKPAPRPERRAAPRTQPARRPAAIRASTTPIPAAEPPIEQPPQASPAADVLASSPERGGPPERAAAEPVRPSEPAFEEIVLPAASVIGLELETAVTSERAQLEDRVEARVTRDVYADGRLAIPAGSRVTGSVTMVERGGKVKERARLGVRFHTLVLANGRQIPLRTETILREGESPANESSRKIGGAAIGGAVLGAILGGGKGAIAGATAGAAGGTAAVMAGGRNAATLASGSIVTVKLSAPASFEVER